MIIDPSSILATIVFVIKYVPPSPISLHFWWYPMITMLTFGGLFIGVAMGMKVAQEHLIFMTLLGLCEAAWIAYLQQILPLGLVVLFDTAFFLYEWRALS